mgnify:FL=1
MKALLSTLIVVLFISCKSTQDVKADVKTSFKIKGTYTMSSVNYAGSDLFKVTSFNIADSQCFVDSEWNFVPNNNTGDFKLTKVGCPAFSSKITWYVNKEGNIVLKILDNTKKAKTITEGYVLHIDNLTETSFQLKEKINIGGKNSEITYQFNKK